MPPIGLITSSYSKDKHTSKATLPSQMVLKNKACRLGEFGGLDELTPCRALVDRITVSTCGAKRTLIWEGALKLCPIRSWSVNPYMRNVRVRTFTIVVTASMGCGRHKERCEKCCHAEPVAGNLTK